MAEKAVVHANKPEAKKASPKSSKIRTEVSQPLSSPADRILYLQRTIGNQAVQRLIRSGALQAKLRIGQPGDKYEQEADRVADAVMRMPEPTVASGDSLHIQRACPMCEEDELKRQPIEEEEELQRQPIEEEELKTKTTSGSILEVQPDIESHIQSLEGGQPLSENDRTFFESQFGHDFRQVRVHTDANAAEAARAVNAQAFTIGQDVVFGTGQYASETWGGKRILAHELTHVVQQKAYSEFIENFSIQRSNSQHLPSAAGSTSQHASSVQGPNIQSCSFRQFALVHMGIGDARRLANEALNAISGNRQRVQNKAQIHFGQPLGVSEYNTIIQRYRHILSTLDSKTYICDACTLLSLSELGIQPPNPDHLPCAQGECRGSRIIICPPFGSPNCPPPGQTIIHEAAHNSGACLDIGRRQGQYPPVSSDGINNAYSYEYFAADVSP